MDRNPRPTGVVLSEPARASVQELSLSADSAVRSQAVSLIKLLGLETTAERRARLAQAGMGGSWWASVLYTVTPNWQLFWLADALDSGKSTFHWGYVAKAFAYALCYVGAALALAVVLFEERELS